MQDIGRARTLRPFPSNRAIAMQGSQDAAKINPRPFSGHSGMMACSAPWCISRPPGPPILRPVP